MMADTLAGFILVIPLIYLLLYVTAWRLVRRKFP
jgi:hypothetical protein